jgi:NADH-quinone oxidoreductase subunit L
MLTHVWIIPALMTVSFVVILFFGRRFSERVTAGIGIGAIGICLVLSSVAGVQWIQRVNNPPGNPGSAVAAANTEAPPGHLLVRGVNGQRPVGEAVNGETQQGAAQAGATGESKSGSAGEGEKPTSPVIERITWFQTDGIHFELGTIADGLAVMMLITVSIISLLVHVYSTAYLHGDRRFTHYYAFLSLFSAAMLFYVISSNTLQMLTGWELVGVCSFVLIGHWWEEKRNTDAALKAFLTNRVGDVGLLIGVILTFFAAGASSFDVLHINQAALSGGVSGTLLLIGALCLFGGVTSKSGQFPLHTWLPDAMAGPTPVSALIHAATMVVAGVYLIARMYPVFFNGLHIGTGNINYVAFIGAFTTVFGASLAFVQYDIKRVLAYSTISQLGYMVLGLGVGAWTGGVFHLFTHAYFKACLFLCAGSVSHAAHHTFDMREMGGLKKYMPRTFWSFTIAMLALIAVPPFAGFWSKDEILAGAAQGQHGGAYWLMLILGLTTAFMTAAYMIRCWWLTFFGEYRGHGEPHESPPVMTIPLVILAFFAVVVGFVNIPAGSLTNFEKYVQPTWLFPHLVPIDFNPIVAALSILLALAGMAVAYQYWALEKGPFRGLTARVPALAWMYRAMGNKYGLDVLYSDWIAGSVKGPIAAASYWFNQHVIDAVVNATGQGAVIAGRAVYDDVDQKAIDGVIIAVGAGAEESGQLLRRIQTGKVQQYAALLFAGAAILAAIFVFTI